jgi:hypothetical protein
MPSAWRVGVTRHPGTGAARERRVSARELVETRAAKKNPFIGLLSGNRQVLAGELVDSK